MEIDKNSFHNKECQPDLCKKILIAEDNAEMRQTLRMFIGKSCVHIYECSDGGEALELYRRHSPEWVLMDLDMKPVDGLTATKNIIARYPSAKICIVTGFNDNELRNAAFNAGAKGFVTKDNLTKLREILSPIH